MTDDLATLIRSAAKSGRLNHLSLAWINGKWSASYRGVADPDKRIVDHSDPADALIAALTGRKMPEPVVAPVKRNRKALIAANEAKRADIEIDEDLL